MTDTNKFGKLYIVATPIGNPQDITLRAIETLRSVDAVICEERKDGSRLLKQLEIIGKPLIELNEHNESDMIQQVLIELMNGRNMALVSDCGTPVFSDPGKQLLKLMAEMRIKVVPVPGASSLTTALSVCPFDMENFTFLGFLPPKTEQRAAVLQKHKFSECPLILMDTPYRLVKLLDEVSRTFGRQQQIFLALDLTLPSEMTCLGTVQDVAAQAQGRKAEFILILDRPQRRKF
ncbi:MAG: 16S rRNA (cytidine(1402)-2'-O)-methyltransferase [Anaerolineaceae bacterium]|nr:16S rRNA (cytidine(1402)-2'-O)-methyltransferase [Anaerolineaceae bacterium]